jgi:hypothetical protein
MVIVSVNELKNALFSSGIAQDYQLVGCTEQELCAIEEKYGKLPMAYKQIMSLLGRRAGRLVSRYEFDFYIDQIPALNERMLQSIKEAVEAGENFFAQLPENAFFICSRYGDDFMFILANGSDESPVYVWKYNEKIEQINTSIWEWMEDWIKDAEALMELENNSKLKKNKWV